MQNAPKRNDTFSSSPIKDNYRFTDQSSFANEMQVDTDDESDCPVWKSRPDVWVDDTRMNALFAPFRNRDLNPLHYDAKLKFWKETILAYCKEKETFQIDLNVLENAFVRKGKRPKCLDVCLSELIKDGAFQAKDDFLKPKTNGILYSMFNKLVWNPLAWSTGYILRKTFQVPASPSSPAIGRIASVSASPIVSPTKPSLADLNSSFSSPRISRAATFTSPLKAPADQNTRRLVFIDLVEKKAYDLYKLLQDQVFYKNTDCVVEAEAFCELAKKVLTKEDTYEEDLDLIVKYLQVQNKIIVDETSIENKRLIKFSYNLNSNVEPLTPIEVSFQELRNAERKLELEMNSLQTQIDNLNVQARESLKLNNKNAALKHLKKRKLLDKSYETKEGALNNVQGMIISIQQADTNKMTFDVYNKSIEALKEVNKDLNIDKVEDTMSELKDIIETNSEIQEALARPVDSAASKYSEEEADLLKELDELMAKSPPSNKDGNKAFDMNKLLESLPAIPTTNPAAQFKVEKKAGESLF